MADAQSPLPPAGSLYWQIRHSNAGVAGMPVASLGIGSQDPYVTLVPSGGLVTPNGVPPGLAAGASLTIGSFRRGVTTLPGGSEVLDPIFCTAGSFLGIAGCPTGPGFRGWFNGGGGGPSRTSDAA